MSELALPEERPAEVVPFVMNSALLLWVQEARQANLVAQSLARTSFVPASLRGKAEDITAAILAGQELGLKPMATLRSLDVIQGTPALRAHAMRGLVQSHGHKVWLVEQTPERVVYRGQRREAEGSYGEVQESEWTIERARQLGLTVKDQWKKQPQTMLTARATGEICRLVASDVIHAMPYAAEELDGYRVGVRRADSVPDDDRVTAEEVLAVAAAPTQPVDEAEAWLATQDPAGAV